MRLIDARYIINRITEERRRWGDDYDVDQVLGDIEDAPTIDSDKLPFTNQWIPCSERLPEDGTWNIFTDGKRISIERYKFDIVSHFWPEPRWFDLEDAVAWMPLPEPARLEGE